MQCSIITNSQRKAPTFLSNWKNNSLLAAALCCSTFTLSIAHAQEQITETTPTATPLVEYNAEYYISRKGERHGNATRSLTKLEDKQYKLSYHSDIEWMIFSDERTETSIFHIHNDKVSPLKYTLERSGTGPDKEYKISFDHQNKAVYSDQSKYALEFAWQDNFQDVLSYQIQLRDGLTKGETQFSFPIVDKNGNNRDYTFEVIGKEMITLPIGNVDTIKVKRVYDNDKRQAVAWFAPEMDYMMVKMYKGKDNMEQFQVELAKYVPYQPL